MNAPHWHTGLRRRIGAQTRGTDARERATAFSATSQSQTLQMGTRHTL